MIHFLYRWKDTAEKNITMKNILEITKAKLEKRKTKIFDFLCKIVENSYRLQILITKLSIITDRENAVYFEDIFEYVR